MKIKVYEFRYSNYADKLAGGLISFFTNLGVPILAFWIIAFAMSLSGVIKYLNVELMMALLGVSIVLGIIFAFRYCFGFKGIVLYDSYMEITTHAFGVARSKPKFEISYSDIASVFNSTFNLRYDRRKARRTFIAGDFSNYVELTLNGGKQFCFSVNNQQEFIQELIFRIDETKNKTKHKNI